MTDDIILSPFGTARQLFQASPEEGGMQQLLMHLGRTVQDFNLESEKVQLAFEASQWQPDLTEEERQSLLLLVLCSLIMQQQGSTRLPLGDEEGLARIQGILKTLLRPREQADEGGLPSPDRVIEVVQGVISRGRADRVFGCGGDFKPLIMDGTDLYHYKMLHLEQRIVQKLQLIMAGSVAGLPEEGLSSALGLLDHAQPLLEEEQKLAVRKAVSSSFTVITGGPGTGKTTVIVSLLRTLLHLGIEPASIALAAPTGKAANRMGESIQATLVANDPLDDAVARIPAPQTLHRLLGYSPSRDSFRHHRNNPLAQQVVIVDEASMIDLFLVERLLGAVQQAGRLVLIGDAEQLPSVDAGAVFKDLVSADRGYTARLEKSHRMKQDGAGKGIYLFAQAIRKGSVDDLFAGSKEGASIAGRQDVKNIRFEGVELHDKGGLPAFLNAWERRFPVTEELRTAVYPWSREGFAPEVITQLDRVFAQVNQCKVLALTRAYQTGVDAVNGYFHEQALRNRPAGGAADTQFLPGEPVMMQYNDYEKMIFNGDQGIVLNLSDEGGHVLPRAVFRQGGSYGAWRLDSLRSSLAHAYAITVHKSQGSEYDHVALILPDQAIPILTREMIYTGVTRSRLSVTIVGNADVLRSGVRQRMVRYSGIAMRMA